MSHLRKTLRLLAVAMLFLFGSGVAVPNAAGAETPATGIDYQTLVGLCDYYQGRIVERELPPPYRYGCQVSDGDIDCLETTECDFIPFGDLPPFQVTCDTVGGRWSLDDKLGTISCDTDRDDVVLTCGFRELTCTFVLDNEPPMPIPPGDER